MNAVPSELIRQTEQLSEAVTKPIPGSRKIHVEGSREDIRVPMREIATGLLYVDPEAGDLHSHLNTVDAALNKLGVAELSPGADMLAKINAGLR